MNRNLIRAYAISSLLWLVLAISPAIASQGSCLLPTTGTISGLTLVQDINSCIDAVQTANNGASAPSNTLGAPGLGQLWLDVSTTPDDVLKMWDGTNWLVLGTINSSSHVWTPPIGGGTNSVVAATSTNLCSVPEGVLTVTGSTTIAGFGSSCVAGTIKVLVFAGTPQITYNATSMILPTGASITATVGDRLFAAYLGGGNWNVIAYQRADGSAIGATVLSQSVAFSGVISPTSLGADTNDWNPTGLVNASGIRIAASIPVSITGLQGGSTGRLILLQNISANAVTLVANSASSSAANRFAVTKQLSAGDAVLLTYDGTSSLWRIAGNSRASLTATRYYAAGTTWTKPAGLAFVIVKQCGGGGGGGGSTGAPSFPSAGGGSAACGIVQVAASSVGATETVTVGAAGTNGSAQAGGNGGTTSFGAWCVTTGGIGGGNGTTGGVGAGGAGGTASACDLNMNGATGQGSGTPSAGIYLGGSGASAPLWGSGGGGGQGAANGGPAGGRGSGGGGSGGSNSSNLSGGAATPGQMVVEEYSF